MIHGSGEPSACRARCGSCRDAATLPPRTRSKELSRESPRFYLHESGGLNFSDIIDEMRDVLSGQPPDLAWPVGQAQHLVDVPLLQALSRHPLRSHDPESAPFHILSLPALASRLLAERRGHPAAHWQRMTAAAQTLAADRHFLNRRAIFVIVFAGIELNTLGEPFQRVIASGNVRMGCNDPTMAYLGPNARSPARRLLAEAITLPYYAHAFATSTGASAPRTGVMFHGGLGRWDFGNRARMKRIFVRIESTQSSVSVDLRTGEVSRGNQSALRGTFDVEAYRRSGLAYQASSICLVPAGDTITSRRLFDALAASCIPVLLRSGYLMNQRNQTFYTALALPQQRDWANISLRLVPGASSSCVAADATWLLAWHARSLGAMRRRGHSAFRRHMDYASNPSGVASALLAELAASGAETHHHYQGPARPRG